MARAVHAAARPTARPAAATTASPRATALGRTPIRRTERATTKRVPAKRIVLLLLLRVGIVDVLAAIVPLLQVFVTQHLRRKRAGKCRGAEAATRRSGAARAS